MRSSPWRHVWSDRQRLRGSERVARQRLPSARPSGPAVGCGSPQTEPTARAGALVMADFEKRWPIIKRSSDALALALEQFRAVGTQLPLGADEAVERLTRDA
jgi:hypothetical protein